MLSESGSWVGSKCCAGCANVTLYIYIYTEVGRRYINPYGGACSVHLHATSSPHQHGNKEFAAPHPLRHHHKHHHHN